MKKPTSSDVARLAGVSQAAVSLILNESDKISFSQQTRERVFAAAKELGYSLPQRKPREHNKFRMLTVFVPTLTNAYYSELVQHVEEYAEPRGYHVMVCNTFRTPELEKYYLEMLLAGNSAGIIYAFLPSFPALTEKIAARIPSVILGEKREELALCSLGLNNTQAGAMLAEHLFALGHRHIAFLSTPLDRFTLARSQRLDGICRQLEQHGLKDHVSVIVADHKERDFIPQGGMPYEYAVGRQLTARFLQEGKKATAIIGVNDMTALGVMMELTQRGFSIPGDYSVCGFDNIFASGIPTPGLTTIEHHLRARCHAAADMLINRESPAYIEPGTFSDQSPVRYIEYSPRLIVRQSTGSCKTGR